MGTIDDLSDDEKTRAFLQLLEYKLRMEKEQVPIKTNNAINNVCFSLFQRAETEETGQKDSSFHELWQRLPAHEINPVRYIRDISVSYACGSLFLIYISFFQRDR